MHNVYSKIYILYMYNNILYSPCIIHCTCTCYILCIYISIIWNDTCMYINMTLLFQKAKDGEVPVELSQLYVNASRRSRDAIAAEFKLQSPLYFSYTHLVCRTAKEGVLYLFCNIAPSKFLLQKLTSCVVLKECIVHLWIYIIDTVSFSLEVCIHIHIRNMAV